jgi:hypothetical protein
MAWVVEGWGLGERGVEGAEEGREGRCGREWGGKTE